MRKDLIKMSKVMAQVKNPNFPPPPTENKMEPSTTYVDMKNQKHLNLNKCGKI